MSDVAECPQCHRQLRVPDELIGRQVKCPSCATAFTAGVSPPPPPSSPPPPSDPIAFQAEPPPTPPPPRGRAEDEEDDFDFQRRQRRDLSPHRGGTILTLGILSLACIPIIFGPIAWVMGNNDMQEIRAGRMDPEGEGLTNAGRICGIIGTILGVIHLCCIGVQLLAVIGNGR
jgi:predicted Zn finger-like uncharacterized protein